jgi:hypothetical protein
MQNIPLTTSKRSLTLNFDGWVSSDEMFGLNRSVSVSHGDERCSKVKGCRVSGNRTILFCSPQSGRHLKIKLLIIAGRSNGGMFVNLRKVCDRSSTKAGRMRGASYASQVEVPSGFVELRETAAQARQLN